MSETADAQKIGPVARSDRIETVDIVRGIALYGVMAMNVVTVFRISIFQQFLPPLTERTGIDRFVAFALQFGVDMKAFSLFSVLFGVGLAIQYERLSRGATPYRWLLRRLFVLLAFGLLHLLVIWNGDILTEYALAGFLVLPFLRCSNWSIGVAATYALILYCFMPLLHLPIPEPSQHTYQLYVSEANVAYRHGDPGAVMRFNFHEVIRFIPLHLYVFPRTVGLFLIGMLIWKQGILRHPGDHRRTIALAALICLSSGAILTAYDVMNLIRPHSMLVPFRTPIAKLAPPMLAMGYGAALVWLAAFTAAKRVLGVFAPLGRMAFTNYLAQSIVFSLLFYGYGLGLAGRTGPAFALLIGTIVYVLQMLLSAWWLRRFRFGPLEWLWRTLMYGKTQPMRAYELPAPVTALRG